MTIGQLHAAKHAALKDYTEAEATANVAKAAYDAATDAYMDAIHPYQATMSGYLDPAGLKGGIPAYRLVYRDLESDIYLLPDNMRNKDVGEWVEYGDYLVKIDHNAP